MVLGMEFLTEAKVSLMPHLFGGMVQDETTLCFVRAALINQGSTGRRFAPTELTKP